MADKADQLIVDALSRASAEPAGLPLYASKSYSGLFAASAPGKKAAQACKDEGFLKVLRTDNRGKTSQEICAITDKGLAYLLNQVNPRAVLEGLIKTVEARQTQVGELLAGVRQIQTGLEALKSTAEKVLLQIRESYAISSPEVVSRNGAGDLLAALRAYLTRRQAAGSLEDCPLPELYRAALLETPSLTIGQFHDALRRLHQAEQIYLHPWTGPLYEIAEPSLVLLVGHEIAYYASLRH